MSPSSQTSKTEFISLAAATTLVSYSRDYIGRLAREGKIISVQNDKQWHVGKASLLQFFENSAIEDSVKKKILSQSRKNDLEAKELYLKRSDAVYSRFGQSGVASLFATICIVVSGLLGGVLVQNTASVLEVQPQAPVTVVLENIWPQFAGGLTAAVSDAASTEFSRTQVVESQETLSLENGILLLPASHNRNGAAVPVPELFSDEVTVVESGTAGGFVLLDEDRVKIPFVRVPQSSP